MNDPRIFKAPHNPKERMWQEPDRLRAAHPTGRPLPVRVLDPARFGLGLDLIHVDGMPKQHDIEVVQHGNTNS